MVKKYVPGYAVNRVQMALFRECVDLVNRGVVSVEDVDTTVTAWLGFRWARAPF